LNLFFGSLGKALKPLILGMSRRRLPQLDGRVYLSSLRRPVSIGRDEWGIPHIQATDRHDLFVAQGFVHAQDRLWQLELNRRAARGELSELFGLRTLNLDRLSRTLGFGRLAAHTWELMDDRVRGDLEAYAVGVNALLESRPRLPVEFSLIRHRPEPWQPLDSLAYAHLQMWALTHGAMGELVQAQLVEKFGAVMAGQLGIAYPDENPLTLPEGIEFNRLADAGGSDLSMQQFLGKGSLDGAGRGSNGWVIAANRSVTGHAILCNDMHLPVGTPSLWYYIHLRSDDGFHVAGFSQPGLPYVLVGHNDAIAWGATLSYVDCEDLFIEELHPNDPSRYRYKGKWRKGQVLKERIAVRGRPEHTETVVLTHHGPIVDKVIPTNGLVMALSSTALKSDAGFDGFALLNKAGSWEEFVAAVSRIEAPSLNLLYADIHDNIGYYVSGSAPVRANGDGTVPVPGWTGTHEWIGKIPFEEMPHALNPSQGYIVSANNRIVGPNYPHFLGRVWRDGYRARRIEQLIAASEKISIEECMRFQMDVYCIPGRKLVDLLGETRPLSQEAGLTLRLLRQWDGWLVPESVGGAVYEILLATFAQAILSPHLDSRLRHKLLGLGPNPLLAPVNEFQGYWPATLVRLLEQPESDWLPDKPGLIERCLNETARRLRSHLGTDVHRWQWGRLHQVSFGHALGIQPPLDDIFDQGPFTIGGDGSTVAQTAIRPDLPYGNNSISISSRQIVDLGELNNSLAMHTPGQSGHLGSAHYGDLILPWLNGGYFQMTWEAESVATRCRRRLVLMPAT
jgi:penicillin amidase